MRYEVTLKAKFELFFDMEESLLSENTSNPISALPLWIIEYAWSKRMVDVLEVLGPPLWFEGDLGLLTLQDPCSIRAVSAEAWMVIQTRDIKHFERLMEFLDVTQILLPHLVTSIKHMKIMFGLKTLVIMWMLWGDQDVASIIDKIIKFFPDSLPQYYRSSHRHMELMQRTHQDFRNFAQSLASNPDMRKVYIRDLMEEQYGECYALKLEERLFHYLQELDKALPQPTYIEKVLKQPWALGEKEELLQQLLTCNTASIHTSLKRLLRCAMTDYFSSARVVRPGLEPFSIAFRLSQEMPENETLSKANLQGTWLDRCSLLQKSSETYLDGPVIRLRQKPSLRAEIDQTMYPCVPEEEAPQEVANGQASQQQEAEDDSAEHLCSRHGKRMKSILLECSEELQAQDRYTPVTQAECTPLAPPTPLLQSTPHRLTQASASIFPDSSSKNISFSSHPDSPTTNLSGAEASQASLSQASLPDLGSSSVQQNTSRTSPVPQPNVSSALSFSPCQVSPSSAISSPQIPASVQSSSSACPSVIPAKQITAHHISPSATSQSSVYPQSSSSTFSFHHIGSPPSLGPEPCSSSSSFPGSLAAASAEQARGAVLHSSDMAIVSEPSRVLVGELKLSSETQAILLLCRWLQPHVRLCRLSQEECASVLLARTAMGQVSNQRELDIEEEEGEENVSFDMNLLYSDSYSESDTHDSDDPDYVPSKRLKA
ncbi:hypothetical protein P4O66_018475 [Electrophorus voltai]|uniref:TERF1-interacting nuclear factor 2 N-terminal domain-containing protein n=1 Tax=Electrophorus voltai TaxID=2609070 RepID=A0AAD8YQM1_9TELE|nr:hypothetical protein P4O66_018475 [Electrophorus voltai]